MEPSRDVARLIEIMARLRDRDTGCPWDVEQSFATIAPHTIEEAYEVAGAIERRDLDDLRGELGDLLLQVVYHAQMAREEHAFDFGDVVLGVTSKLIRRHPHVFGEEDAAAAADVKAIWERVKSEERSSQGRASVVDDVPRAMPALARAAKLQKRAASIGFDWPDAAGPAAKVREELAEIEAADGDADALEDEIGDLLFSAVNLARHLGVAPEHALSRANAKFVERLREVERRASEAGESLADMPMERLGALWEAAKAS